MASFFYAVSIAFHTCFPALQKCMLTFRKNSFCWERSHSCTACCTSSSDLLDLSPSPFWAVHKHECHGGRGLASTADVEGTRRTDLELLQNLNGQYGAEHFHVGAKRLYSDVHVVWTRLLDAGDSSGDLRTSHWSQSSPWAYSVPKLPLVHPKWESA